MAEIAAHIKLTGPGSRLEKVTVPLEPADWHSFATESVWAERLDDERFRIANVPFLAKGLSLGDVVCASRSPSGFEFVRVEVRGGHSTYRFVLRAGTADGAWLPYWVPLEHVGCTFERATERLVAVDVPPSTNIHDAFRLLEDGERAGVWTFEEGHCGHKV